MNTQSAPLYKSLLRFSIYPKGFDMCFALEMFPCGNEIYIAFHEVKYIAHAKRVYRIWNKYIARARRVYRQRKDENGTKQKYFKGRNY